MNSCRKIGSTDTALGPTAPSSVGTSRQPRTLLPFLDDDTLEERLDLGPKRGIARQEYESGAVMPLGRERDPDPRRFAAQEPIGHLNQDARAVARVRLAATGAAMEQVDEHLQRLPHDRVRALPLDVHDEAHTAGVVLVAGVVKTLRGWKS